MISYSKIERAATDINVMYSTYNNNASKVKVVELMLQFLICVECKIMYSLQFIKLSVIVFQFENCSTFCDDLNKECMLKN